jgi:hypothetical protein
VLNIVLGLDLMAKTGDPFKPDMTADSKRILYGTFRMLKYDKIIAVPTNQSTNQAASHLTNQPTN